MDLPQVEIVAAAELPRAALEELTQICNRLAAQLLPRRQVSLKLMGEDEIRSLNREYRDTDRATDVLSFPSGMTGGTFAGDIALCWPVAQRQAVANGNSELAEAAALAAHSMLHLAGYTHDNEADQRRMDELTRRACRSSGIEVERFGH